MKRSLALLGLTMIAGFILVAIVSNQIAKPLVFHGSLIEPPVPAKDFLLYDQHEQPFRLSDQRGKVVLLFFGYTYCPDVCPATLVDFKKIFDDLGNRAEGVDFVFITVDPERDTTQQLQNHLAAFNPAFFGLRGEPEQLERVWADYGVSPKIQPGAGTAGYTVDHPARVYAVDRAGNLRLTFPFGISANAVYQDILHLLNEPTP